MGFLHLIKEVERFDNSIVNSLRDFFHKKEREMKNELFGEFLLLI